MRAAGAHYEERACKELQRAGLKLLDRNFTTRHGEIDLVMLDGDTIVFIEIRHRGRATHGSAAESITAAKQRKLIAAAQGWLMSHPAQANWPCRFDAVSYDGSPGDLRAHWYKNAFEVS